MKTKFGKFCTWLSAVVFAFACANAWAEGKDIVIHADGSVTYGGGSAATYSSGNYYAITKAGDFGDSVSSIKTEGDVAATGTSITFTGLRCIDAASAPLSISSLPGGIDIANNGWIGAINQQSSTDTAGTSDMHLEGIGDIKVKSTGSYGAKGFGIYSAKNPDITKNKFYAAGNSLTVEAEGTAYGIHGALAGRTATINIANAVTVKGVGASGKAYGSNFTAATPMGQSEWNFGSLTVSSESQLAYGLHCAGGVTAQVALNGDMIVTGATYAIGFRLAGTADFTLKGKDAKPIDVKVMSGSNYAMAADIGGSSSTAKLDLTADNFIVMSSTEAYGPYVENAGAGFFGDVRNLSVNGGTGTACALYVNGGTASLVGCTNLVAQGATGSTAIQAENGATVSLGEAELPTALAGDVTLEAGATLNLSNAVDLAGNVANAGTISISYKADRPAIALTGEFANTGTLAVDMTGADADVEYTLIDNLDGSENAYGTISITPGWSTKVVEGDLVAYVKRTCQIGDKKYSTLQEALSDVKAGETVELLCDIEDAGAVTVASETTLKANGKKLMATDVTMASSFKVEATGLEENTEYWVMFYDASGSWCGNDLYTTAAGQTAISVTKTGTNAAKARVYKNDGQWNPEPNVAYSLVGGTLALDPEGTVEFSGTMANTGTILVDMTGAAGDVYKLADYTGAAYASYGAKGVGYKFKEGADNGYAFQALDGDLYAYKGATASKETLVVKGEWVGTAFGETVTFGDADYVYGVNAFGNFEDMTAGISDETTAVVINGEEFGLNGNSGIQTISNTSGETMTISTVGAAKSSAPESCNGTYLTIGTRADLQQDYVLAEGSDLTVFQLYTEANENITFLINGALKAEGSILLKDYSNVTVGKTGTLTLDGSSRPSASGTNFHDWGLLTVYGVLNLGLRDFGGWRVQIGDDGSNNDDMELNVVGGTVNVYSVENATGVEKYSTKDPAVTLVGGYDPEYDSTPATLSVSEGGAYVTEGKIVNHGLVAIAAGANESGRTSQIVASSFDGEHGMVLVDMAGATEKSYKLIDVSAASSYGAYAFAEGKDCGYTLSVVDNDLVAVKAVAKIGDVGFETLWSAILAAKDMSGTAENPTVVQLMPGVVQEGNIYKNTFDLSNVVIQGAADGTSTIKDCCISFQGGYDKVWKNVTFKDIVWDASYIVFSVFKSEDLVFDGNTFTNQTRSGSLGGVHFTTECKNLTYVNNRFEGGTDGSIAAINSNGSGLTGNITITNNIFRNSHWRSLQLMFKSNDGVNDTLTIRDNWFSGNASSVQIVGSGDASADTVVANIQYNVFDDVPTTYSLIMYNTNPEKTTYNNDHNYYVRNPDAAPGYFYANWGACKAYNVFNFGVYPYYSAYHKDELLAGTMTVRESLYNLVQPGAAIVKADGKAQVYPDLAAALEASEAGDRVRMLVASGEEVVLNAGVTLDPNGFPHGEVRAANGSILKANEDGTFTALTAVAEIVGGLQYDTLANALAAVGDGQTVKVLKSGNVVTEYAKRIDEEGYGEGVGANRLIFGTDAKFVLDLNGQTLTGRINFTKGDMTVSNGTLKATSQVLNVFGRKTASSAEEAAESHTTLTIAADCSVEGGNFGVAVFGGNQGNIYWPLGFGETVNVYGKIKALYGAIQNTGNVGMDTYEDNIGTSAEVEAVTNALKMGVSAMMAKYGPVVNVYDGAVLETIPGETEDSSQGISSQGMATYNIYGGKVSGAEAIGVKGGIVNVMGGEMTAFGVKANPIEAVNSGTEVSGGGIAISTSYNGNYPIVVNVTGGTVKSANNAALLFEHSWTFDKQKQPVAPCPVVQGVTFAVSGGTFIGAKDELAIKVEDAIAGDAETYPANFIWPELGEDGETETGYPLCSSRIPADSVAEGYVAKDNKNGTWTVTAGAPEIKTDTKDVTVTPKTEDSPAPVTQEEAQQKAEEVKDDIVKAMKDPEIADLVGTGLKENVFEQDAQGNTVLKNEVVVQLQTQAVQDAVDKIVAEMIAEGTSEEEARAAAEHQKPAIQAKVGEAITKNSSSNTESHVEVKLTAVEVAVSKESTEATVVESTLTKATFDIKPIVTLVTKIDDVVTKTTIELNDGGELANPVLVRLWLNADFIGTVAKVTHKHRNAPDEVASARVQTGVNEKGETRKFVEVSWQRFSEAIVEAEDTTGKACLANGKMFEKVADALSQTNDLPADATIELLADCAETTLALGVNRTLVLSGHAFTGSLAAVDGKEMVKTKSGEVFYAPEKIDVPVGTQGNGVPIRGFNFTGTDVAGGTKEQKAEYLAQVEANGNLRWQNYVLFGSDAATTPKLIPQIVKAATGFSTVKIKAQDGYAVSTPEKCGVGVKFQLMRCDTSATGTYVLVGVPKDEPVFAVDVKEIGAKTYWKIQTIFETTEDLPTQAPTTAN